MNFDTAFHKLLGHEGAYANHPNDPGGETMWGVTKRVAQANGYMGEMRDLSVDTAKAIYRKDYWNPVQAEKLPSVLRYAVFDAAVNSGVAQSAKWLQRAVGVTADGVIGNQTLAAVSNHDPDVILRKILAERLQFMTDLNTWASFGRGWARRIASLMRES